MCKLSERVRVYTKILRTIQFPSMEMATRTLSENGNASTPPSRRTKTRSPLAEQPRTCTRHWQAVACTYSLKARGDEPRANTMYSTKTGALCFKGYCVTHFFLHRNLLASSRSQGLPTEEEQSLLLLRTPPSHWPTLGLIESSINVRGGNEREEEKPTGESRRLCQKTD